MPGDLELRIPVDVGDAEQQLKKVEQGVQNISAAVTGTERKLEDLKTTISGVAAQLGISVEAVNLFAQKLDEATTKGITGDRALRESMIATREVVRNANPDNAPNEILKISGSDLRGLQEMLALIQKTTAAVEQLVKAGELLRGGGGKANFGKLGVQLQHLQEGGSLTAGQARDVNDMAESMQRSARLRQMQEENDRLFTQRARQIDAAAGTIPTAQGRMQYGFNKNQAAGQAAAEAAAEKEATQARLALERDILATARERGQMDLRDAQQVARLRREDEAARLRAEEQVLQLEKQAAMAGLSGGAAVRQRYAGMISGLSPELRSRAVSAVDTLAEEAGEVSGGGFFTPRRMRGLVQGAMGLGVGDYRLYYLANAVSNAGGKGRMLQGLFPGSAGSDGSGGFNYQTGETFGDGGIKGIGATAAGIPIAGVAAGSLAILGLAAAEVAAANSASQHARELRNLAEELGTTTTGARQLENAAKVSGVSIETMASGMRQLVQGVTESSGRGRQAGGVLGSLGVNPVDSLGQLKDTKQLLFEISDSIRGMGDVQARDVLERLFGRGGREMLPLLKQDIRGLTESLDGLNDALDDPRYEKYSEAMSKLSLLWEGLVAQAAKPILFIADLSISPAFKWLADLLTKGPGKALDDVAAPGRKSDSDTLFGRYVLAGKPGGHYLSKGDILGGGNTGESGAAIGPAAEFFTDLDAGRGIIQHGIAGLENTKEGISKVVQSAQTRYDEAVKALYAPRARGTSASRDVLAEVGAAGDALEKEKAKQKALNDNGSTTRSLERERDKAVEGELFGYQKINQEMKDRLAMLAEEGKLTSTNKAIVGEIADAEKKRYDQEIRILQTSIARSNMRSGEQAQLGFVRSTSGSSAALARAGAVGTITTGSDITGTYNEAIHTADIEYQLKQSEIGGLRDQLISPGAKGYNAKDQLKLQGQIQAQEYAAQIQKATAYVNALNAAQTAGIVADRARTKEAISYADALEKASRHERDSAERNQIELGRAVTGVQTGIITRGLSGRLAVMRAQSMGGAGAEARLAGAEESLRIGTAQRAYGLSMGDLQQDMSLQSASYQGDLNAAAKGHYGVLNTAGITDVQTAAENRRYEQELRDLRIQNANEVAKIQKQAIEDYGKFQEEMDTAHIDRVKQAAEAMKAQNEAAQNFAGGLIDAYMQAMLHRQSGVFPLREALGKDILGWGSKIGRNIVGGIFGQAQKRGLVTDLPGIMANDKDAAGNVIIDPATGKPKQHETALGRALSGTPLGHHAQPVSMDKSVTDISHTATGMWGTLKEILEKLAKNNPNSSPDPGASKDNPIYAVPGTDPTSGSANPGGVVNIPGSGLPGLGGIIRPGKSGGIGGVLDGILGGGSGGDPMFGGPFSPGIMDNWGTFGDTSSWDVSAGNGGVPISDNGTDVGTGIDFGNGRIDLGNTVTQGMGADTPMDMGGPGTLPYGRTIGPSTSPQTFQTTATIAQGPNASQTFQNIENGSPAGVVDAGIGAHGQAGTILGDIGGADGSTGVGSVFSAMKDAANTIAKVAGSVPGGQVVAAGAQIAAMVYGGIAAIFGDPRTTRTRQEQYEQEQNLFTAPSAYNLVTTQHGQSATYDSTGAPRGFNGPLLAYPNTTAYTAGYDYQFNRGYAGGVPGGVVPVPNPSNSRDPGNLVPGVPVTAPGPTVNISIQAIDAQSLQDRAHVITDAVNSAINEGHQIRQTIGTLINPH